MSILFFHPEIVSRRTAGLNYIPNTFTEKFFLLFRNSHVKFHVYTEIRGIKKGGKIR